MTPRPKQPGASPLLVSIAILIMAIAIVGSITWVASRPSQPAAFGAAVTVPDTATPVVQAVVDTPVPVDTPTPDNTATSVPSTAYMLAVIQAGSPLDTDDTLVTEFQGALDSLEAKCTETEKNLSDFTVVIHDAMHNRGVEESYLSILTHVTASIPASITLKEPCKGVFAAYATLRLDG